MVGRRIRIEALQEMFGENCHVATEGEKLPVVGERYGRNKEQTLLSNSTGRRGFDLNAETDKFEVVGDWYRTADTEQSWKPLDWNAPTVSELLVAFFKDKPRLHEGTQEERLQEEHN